MKLLDANDLRCCFCGQPIGGPELVAVIEGPGGMPAVTHLDHEGVRKNLVTHPCQITTGALLSEVGQAFAAGITSDEAFAAMLQKHATMTPVQQTRLAAMNDAALAKEAEDGD